MKTLRKGDRGEDVKVLQKKLNVLADGIFGAMTEEAVRQFQGEMGLAADGVAGPRTWGALGPGNLRRVDEIIVHYTATPEGEEFSNEQIRASHLQRGFSDIGYHYVVGLKGEVRKGRDESIAGAHCLGHNTRSIGVCYVGGCPSRSVKGWRDIGKDTRTEAQKRTLLKLLKELKRKYPDATVHGHREFANKPCPGFDAREEYKGI